MMRALSLDRSFANGAVHYGTSCGLCHWNNSEKMIRIILIVGPKQVLTAGKLKSLRTSYKGKRIGMVILAFKDA